MPAAAKPYDFDEFAGAPASEPEPAYCAADLEAACEKARAEALKSRTAQEAAEQARQCAAIAERLEILTQDRDDAIAVQAAALVAIARDIVREICLGAAMNDKGEAALALLERYLASTPDRAPARLVVCDTTSKSVLAKLKKAIAAHGAETVITVETSNELAPGDCRISWRDGAMARELKDILTQIETIFAGVENDAASKRAPGR